MKCVNCGVEIAKEFSFALSKNQCPACGEAIMPAEQLASFNSLRELLSSVPNIDAEMVSSLVVSNFELKQLLRTEPKKNVSKISKSGNIETVEEDVMESSEELTDKEIDELHKKKQVAEAKKKLKQMKQDAYEDVLREQYGMGEIEDEGDYTDGSSGFFDSSENPIENMNRMKNEQLRQTRHSEMLSGSGGFTRSSE